MIDEQPGAGPASGDGVATAREKIRCPACGAEANWDPAKQKLLCPFCGTQSPATLELRDATTIIVEHDLVEVLANVPRNQLGWKASKTTVRCQSCKALSVFNSDRIGQRCEFCGSAQLVPYDEVQDTFRPESLLPLKLSETQARDQIRAWFRRQWLAPNGWQSKALTDTVRALYLPYWTFDADVFAHWTAESGTYYYTGSGKKRERHVRWTAVSGELSHVFDDELVSASLGVNADRLKAIEPFPTNTLIPYDPGYLAGWTVERYQVDLVAAAQRSRVQMNEVLRTLCGEQIAGDTHRNLQVQATFRNQKFKHVLVPVWLMTYLYRAASYQVVVNGVTGKLSGSRPWSWIKIILLVITAIVAIGILVALNNE